MAIPDASVSSTHTLSTLRSDKALRPFLAPSFDPADFLNATLPAWTPSRQQSSNKDTASLAEISAQTQTLLTQLNAQLTRLSSNLNTLTDEILRSGGRLAYEVEVLRGDTSTLSELLTQGLADEIKKFSSPTPPQPASTSPTTPRADLQLTTSNTDSPPPESDPKTPDYITRLSSLAIVRDRLDSVIQTFGRAGDWAIPPSSVTSSSTLLTIAPPVTTSNTAAGGGYSEADLEAQGKEYTEKLRGEVMELLQSDGAGVQAAMKRVEALRELAGVWTGTVEEKARMQIVAELERLVVEWDEKGKGNGGRGYRVGGAMVYGKS